MGMIFTHGITDDTRTFSMWLIRSIVQLDHGIQHSPLYGFQSIPYIRKSPGSDHAHGIIDIKLLHGLFQIPLMDLVKNIVFHGFSS